MDQYYIFLSDTDSKTLYPNNSGNNFTAYLPQSLDLQGTWMVAVTCVALETTNPSFPGVLVCCDLCEDSIVGDARYPILRNLTFLKRRVSWEFTNLEYHRVKKNRANSIRIYIKEKLNPVPITKFMCTLHLKRVG
jgi:hypothetical protein